MDINTIYTFIKSLVHVHIQVLNEANLKDAVLVRSVLTRSDLGGALIEGADFSDAVLDLLQKQVCRITYFNSIGGFSFTKIKSKTESTATQYLP